jgi:hypothetical protein
MNRPSPSQASGAWAIILGVTIPLITALAIRAGNDVWSSKLDVSRFERDSVSSDYESRIMLTTLLRIDSTTQHAARDIREIKEAAAVLAAQRRGR